MPEAIVLTASRRLLRNLRDVMAAPGSAQARLDKVVKLIAANMVAEVCSIYVLRAGEVLELFATEGLNPDAVHKTRLRVGEGLVGDIAAHARPLALERRPGPSAVRLPAGNRRRDLPLADGRADPARRPGHRRRRGAEPHAPPLHRGGGRDAPDHRHGAGRAGRRQRPGLVRRAQAGRRHRAPAAAPRGPVLQHRHRHGPGRAARAAHRGEPPRRRGSGGRAPAPARGGQGHALRPRRPARRRRPGA